MGEVRAMGGLQTAVPRPGQGRVKGDAASLSGAVPAGFLYDDQLDELDDDALDEEAEELLEQFQEELAMLEPTPLGKQPAARALGGSGSTQLPTAPRSATPPTAPRPAAASDAAPAFPSVPQHSTQLGAPMAQRGAGLPAAGTAKEARDNDEAEMARWCHICTENDAVCWCVDCDHEPYCARCWRECHDEPDLRLHRRVLIRGC